jgi:Tol biopolymer transport system component/DNA-binding winged helix-turn-helix (wHTH) protein
MEAEVTRYQFDTIEVQPAAFAVFREGVALNLEPKAVRVLLYLIANRHRAVTKDELFEKVWEETSVSDNALTRIIAQIRRELGDDARQARYIQTLPTTGYRFVAELREASPRPVTVVEAVEAEVPPLNKKEPTTWRWVGGAVIALGLAVTGIVFGWRSKGSASTHPVRSMQVTSSASLDIGAAFSPDGKSFVYSSNRSGQFELYRRPVAYADGEVQITRDGHQNIDPVWSPDGKWVAYHSVAQHGIWLIPASGEGAAKRLTDFGSAPSWSPDSRQIAFRSAEPISLAWFDLGGNAPSTLWAVAVDGSKLQRLTMLGNPFGQHAMPSWSPDGKKLLFVALSKDSAVYSLELATGKSDLLMQVGKDIPRQEGTWWTRLWDPRYGPDGESIYFSAITAPGSYGIFVQKHPGEKPVEVYAARGDVPSSIAISPDGQQMLLTRLSSVSQLWSVGSEGSEPRPVFRDAVMRSFLPSFSPDGKWLAFMVETEGRNRDLWIMNADGSGGASPISRDAGPKEGGVVWSSVHSGLLYNYIDGNQVEYRRYDPVEKKSYVIQRATTSAELFHPVMMPDEKEVLSSCSRPLNVCLSPIQGGPPRQVTFERDGAQYPNASRDGQWISYNLPRAGSVQIGLVKREGGRTEVLTDEPGLNWAFTFSDDNRKIAYTRYRDGVWNVWWVDRETRERRQLTQHTAYGAFVRSPAWRPGGKEIVYEYWQAKGNIHLLQLK